MSSSNSSAAGSTIPPAPDATSYGEGATELRDTTRPIAEVRRELNMNLLESFLFWLCKADIYALRVATYETRLQFQGFGLLVLVTSLLAFCSMCFALSSTVFQDSWAATGIAAFLYSMVILMVEREIVDPSKSSWLSFLFRGVMAFIIALVISFPFEAQILKTRINEQIMETTELRSKPLREEQRQIERDADRRMSSAVQGSTELLVKMRKQEAILLDELDLERRRLNSYGPKSERLEQKVTALRQEIAKEQAHLDAINKDRFNPEEKERYQQIETSISSRAAVLTDPLSRLEALTAIGKKVPEAFWMSLLLKAFFVILELMPAMMKLLAPKTEYTFYVEARRALNEVMINAPTNYVIGQVIANPQQAWGKYRQILDLIEHGIEDRATMPGRSLRDVMANLQQSYPPDPTKAPPEAGSGTPTADTPPKDPPQGT